MLGFLCDIWPKVPSKRTMPCGIMLLVKRFFLCKPKCSSRSWTFTGSCLRSLLRPVAFPLSCMCILSLPYPLLLKFMFELCILYWFRNYQIWFKIYFTSFIRIFWSTSHKFLYHLQIIYYTIQLKTGHPAPWRGVVWTDGASNLFGDCHEDIYPQLYWFHQLFLCSTFSAPSFTSFPFYLPSFLLSFTSLLTSTPHLFLL